VESAGKDVFNVSLRVVLNLILSALIYEHRMAKVIRADMAVTAIKKSEGLWGATLVGGVLILSVITIAIFSAFNIRISPTGFAPKDKYPARAFVIKRQGPLKSKTTYAGVAGGTGMRVDVKFNNSDQKLMVKIQDRTGKPMERVTVEARANKAGRSQKAKSFAMKEYENGEYRSDAIGLDKGGWILSVTAYDLYNRGDNKLLFHAEKPVFMK